MSDHEYGEPSQEWDMDHDGDGYLINGVIYVPDTYEEYRADAHLIIAAKDLLYAAEEVLANCRIFCADSMDIDNQATSLLEGAVKKARGAT